MIIQHNMSAVNIMTQLGITNTNFRKSVERLSSGYKINRAADDAAGLQISEKKRSQVRGLIRAAKNAEDGISFVRVGDGAMDQMEGLLQRMRELTIQSLNDTNTDADRAAMQMEFDELQSEIDRINNQSEFNTRSVFEHYPDTYYEVDGNRHWVQDQKHLIDNSNNSLTISYQIEESEPEKQMTLTIPVGTYTTQELIDTMDDVVTAMGDAADGLYLEYDDDGCCNMILRDGEKINDISGGLSYLFFDEFQGSEVGSLIGTTVFDPRFPLLVDGRNNELKFTIENFDGSSQNIDIAIAPGLYTREEMIDYLNRELAGTGMTAKEYGDRSIQVGGDDGIITGLKGNMFEIDDPGSDVRVSVFYDNTKYGKVTTSPAAFKGGAVLPLSDVNSYNRFHIGSTNNTLRFKVNMKDTDPYVELTLPSGDYTINEMVTALQTKINEELKNAGKTEDQVKVAFYNQTVRSVNGNNLTFYGLQITSNESGLDSKIEFDIPGSSAYETLFTNRTYTDQGKKVSISKGSYSYTAPYLTGGRSFAGEDFPLSLDGTNSAFQLQVTEQISNGSTLSESTAVYTVKLTEKTYSSVSELIAEIDNQINGAGASTGIKGKLQISTVNGAIRFSPASGNKSVTKIYFAGTDTTPYAVGYDTLFVGKTTKYTTRKITDTGNPPSVTLDKITFPLTVSQNEKLSVSVDNVGKTVTIPPGTYDADSLADIITRQLKGTTTTQDNVYSGYGVGTTTDRNYSYSNRGTTSKTNINCNVHGSGGMTDGSTEIENAKPATYTLTLPSYHRTSVPVTADNDTFVITMNGHTYTTQLDHGTYTPAQLAEQLNSKLDSAITSPTDKVHVTLSGTDKLVFTSEKEGKNITMQFNSTKDSSFLDKTWTNMTPAQITVSRALQNSVVLDSSNNRLSMWVGNDHINVMLDTGTYTKDALMSQLNTKLGSYGIVASLSGSYLQFKTAEAKGSDSYLKFDTADCGTIGEAFFGNLIRNTAASATLNIPIQDTVTIEPGKNDFSVQLTQSGVTANRTISIPSGAYSRNQLVQKMNDLFGGDVTVRVNSSGIPTFTTAAAGSDVSIRVNNSIGGDAGNAIFGENTVTTPDVTASIQNDKLVLTGSSSSSSYPLTVTSRPGSVLFPSDSHVEITNPTKKEGKASISYYTLTSGATLPSPVTLDSGNNEFHFVYNSPGGQQIADITFASGDYTPEQMKQELQQKIDDAIGADKLTVLLTSTGGISIKSDLYGDEYYLNNTSGSFYEYVLNGTAIRQSKEKTDYTAGKQVISDTYIIGRRNVNNQINNIQKNVSDTLSIDLTIDNTVHTLSMTLDSGKYSADQLVRMLQKKIDEQVVAAGLPEGMLKVAVGRYDTGVIGADDKNALDFFLNPDVKLPPGNYKIDGLAGSSLFEIFYKTEGDLIPAYITVTKDYSNGVEVEPGKNEFSIDVDGITYTYTVTEGSYTGADFVDILNQLFLQPDNSGKTAPINASMVNDSLRISHNKVGKHTIGNIQGPAKTDLFYEMKGRTGYDSGMILQIGANANQIMELERFSLSTMSMGINSITISKYKNSEKALGRLDNALTYLNDCRSKYGARQNRLEYTVKGNNNTAENLQASESRDRDTDMAKEMMEYAKTRILQQAGMAMLTQANQQTSSVIQLLQ